MVSVSKDPKFVKGYYRLSSAQIELQQFDDAEATLKAALAIDPGNRMSELRNMLEVSFRQ